MIELVGYMASAFIVLSLCMSRMKLLRLFSIVGGVLFVVYGFLIGSAPVVITNGSAIGANLFNLWRSSDDS